MADIFPANRSANTAGFVLGEKLDSIPFSAYHVLIIAVLALVGFIEGYDLVMTGSLLALAKAPLSLERLGHPLVDRWPRDDVVRRRLSSPPQYPIIGAARRSC